MTKVDPSVGLLGKAPVLQGDEKLAIQYIGAYATVPLTGSPESGDVTGGLTDILMLGNGPDPTLTLNGGNPVGDCVPVAEAHNKMIKAKDENEAEANPTADSVVGPYLKFDHNQDEGVIIAKWLLWQYQQGNIEAFAPIDITDRDQLQSAMLAFHGVIIGVDLTDDAQQLFPDGVWNVDDGQKPNPEMGHGILFAKYDPENDEYGTWARWMKATKGWTKACATEGWVIVTSEDAAAANVDINALRADIDALHGTEKPAAAKPEADELADAGLDPK